MATVAEPKRRTRGKTNAGGGGGAGGAGAATGALTTPKEAAAAATTGARAGSAKTLWRIELFAVPGATRGGPWNERYQLRDMESTTRVMDSGIKTGLSVEAFADRAFAAGCASVTLNAPPGEPGGGGGGGAEGGGGSGPKRGKTRTRTRSKG